MNIIKIYNFKNIIHCKNKSITPKNFNNLFNKQDRSKSILNFNKSNYNFVVDKSSDYFFRKQEYDKAYKFLSEEMKDCKSILVYSRKIPSNLKMKAGSFLRYTFYNSVFYILFANGIYNFIFLLVASNIIFFSKMLINIYKNSKIVSSIFLMKTQNDFSNETEFYIMIGYGLTKKMEIINLLNFSGMKKSLIENELYILEDSKLINLGYNIDFIYDQESIIIFNKEVFKYFFKQDKQIYLQKQRNQMNNPDSDIVKSIIF